MEKIEGIKINNVKRLEENGYDNKEIARKLALSYCKQIFEDGFFHADPHPGNILIKNGKICFIDFGIVGIIDDNLKEWMNSAMLSIVTRDKTKLVECILAIGIKQGKIDKGQLYNDISYLVDMYLTTSLKNIKIGILLQEVFDITKRNNIQLPRELVILVRGLMILEGVVAEIDPELEIITVAVSFAKSQDRVRIFKDITKEEIYLMAYQYVRDTSRIPGKALEVLNKTENGNLQVKFSINNMEKTISKLDTMVNRITGSLIIASLVISSSLIVSNNVGPTYKGISIIGIVGYIISSIFALILLRSMIKTGLFRNDDTKKY